jgi:hypothetical protein
MADLNRSPVGGRPVPPQGRAVHGGDRLRRTPKPIKDKALGISGSIPTHDGVVLPFSSIGGIITFLLALKPATPWRHLAE